MEKQNPTIHKFSGRGAVTIENFIKYFERRTEDKKDERSELLVEFLEEEALNYALGQDLYKLNWEEAKTKITDYFAARKKTTMQDLLNIKLADTFNIETYFRMMTDAALDLEISDNMLLELLISGLTPNLKTLNLTRNFESTSEWLEVNRSLFHHLEKEGGNRKVDKTSTFRAVESGEGRAPMRRPTQWQPRPQNPRWKDYPARTAQHAQYQPPAYQRPWRIYPDHNMRGWERPSYNQGPWRPYRTQPMDRQRDPNNH